MKMDSADGCRAILKILVLRPPSPFILSPQERKLPLRDFGFTNDCSINPAAGFATDAAHVSPSPWGEGGLREDV
jgi:hypothetical protein